MKNRDALSGIAMDLRRVALGYHRGSIKMAERFFEEAMKRKQEIDIHEIKPYLRRYLDSLTLLNKKNKADDILMYSVLFQNAAVSLR